MAGKEPYKVIDIFAGPGGLGEGFAAFGHGAEKPSFKLALSIEKDPTAHSTLLLRSFYRQRASAIGNPDFHVVNPLKCLKFNPLLRDEPEKICCH